MRTCLTVTALTLATVTAAACGDSKSSMMPTAPTIISAADATRAPGSAAAVPANRTIATPGEARAR